MAGVLLRGHERRHGAQPARRAWLTFSAVVAVRLIEPGACLCRVPCVKECETLLRLSGVPEPAFRPAAFEILEATYHTRDLGHIAQIREAICLAASLPAPGGG